jgi:hypothetical protein
MKRILPAAVLIFFALLFHAKTAHAAAHPENQPAANGGALCLPGVYLESAPGCLALGPSAYLTDMARHGISFPARPLPAVKPDPYLVDLPFSYAVLKDAGGSIYGTADDALAGTSPVSFIQSGEGLKFISYINTIDVNGDGKPDVFQLKSGGWVSSRDVSTRWSALSRFQGLVFRDTPLVSFGFVNAIHASIETKRTPGYFPQDYTGNFLPQYSTVHVYDIAEAGGMEWFNVGPDEWVEARFVGRVMLAEAPPEGVTNGRWIEINLQEQTVSVYENNRLVFATLVASGVDFYWTRPGLFQVYQKLDTTPMMGAFEADRSDFYYLEDVPWTLYYDEARALHGAYWRARLGFPQSHGCVNMTTGDAQWLYNWAEEGDWVYVWDPSGRTPEDPSLYSAGGA